MGSHNSGWITESIARGDSLNSLFAFQAFAILAGSFIFVVYLEKVGFFRLAKGEAAAPERVAGQAPSTPMSLMDWPIEELEAHFRELGLTRQQAMIAALLARKTPDTTICDNLNISPSTLKTHIRNIHRRLGISSRHELAWLESGGHFRNAGRRPLAALRSGWRIGGKCRCRSGRAVEAEEAVFRERLFCVP